MTVRAGDVDKEQVQRVLGQSVLMGMPVCFYTEEDADPFIEWLSALPTVFQHAYGMMRAATSPRCASHNHMGRVHVVGRRLKRLFTRTKLHQTTTMGKRGGAPPAQTSRRAKAKAQAEERAAAGLGKTGVRAKLDKSVRMFASLRGS
eukprot:2764867-Amphidinium_carterae.1